MRKSTSCLFVYFDTEVVDDEGEGNISCVMEKESFNAWCLVVAEFFKMCNQIVMCNFPGLF